MRGDEQARVAVADRFGDAARARGDDRPGAGHRFENRGAEAFGDRAHHEQVERLQQSERVGAKAAQEHMALEAEIVNLPLQRLPQFAVAHDEKPRVGHSRMTRAAAATRCRWPLCAASAATLPTSGAPVGSQNAACASTAGCLSMNGDVDAVMDDLDASRLDAVALEHVRNQSRRGDEYIDMPVLPLRERVLLQVKIHATRGDDERPRAKAGVHTQRDRHERHGHRIVRMHDVGPDVGEHARQLPGRLDVELASRRESDEAQAFARAPAQFAGFVRDEHGVVAAFGESGDGEQHLVLPAAPRPRRVDVYRSHGDSIGPARPVRIWWTMAMRRG